MFVWADMGDALTPTELVFFFFVRDLMELSPKEIVATFQEHQKSLEQFFDLYKNAPEYAFPKLGYDGTKFIQTLLTENQQKAMVNKMKATFCPDEEYGVTAVSSCVASNRL